MRKTLDEYMRDIFVPSICKKGQVEHYVKYKMYQNGISQNSQTAMYFNNWLEDSLPLKGRLVNNQSVEIVHLFTYSFSYLFISEQFQKHQACSSCQLWFITYESLIVPLTASGRLCPEVHGRGRGGVHALHRKLKKNWKLELKIRFSLNFCIQYMVDFSKLYVNLS